jgi:biotin operon repressor
LEVLAEKITRRQAIILRLIMMGVTSQVDIAKMLGYSFVTISVDIKKLRKIVQKVLKDENNLKFTCPDKVLKLIQ